ncbi:hypothetical protein BJV77DRAFT_961784 [Russula vinacea]|nr:hypothetical protein BJV77DRAFT_961784 [Russula vinacea]
MPVIALMIISCNGNADPSLGGFPGCGRQVPLSPLYKKEGLPPPAHFVRAKPRILLPTQGRNVTIGDSPHHTYGHDNMVKTGIPFMLNDRTGSLSGSEFVDLYDRIYLRVCCTHRDPNGASHYGMYNMLARHHEIPVVTFEYGAGGALGNITFISSEGSMRTQAMAAFLVEVGGPRHRKFTASDGREYSWSWRTSTQEDLEWSRAVFEQSGGFTVRQRERTYCCMVCGFIRLYVWCGGAVPPSRSRFPRNAVDHAAYRSSKHVTGFDKLPCKLRYHLPTYKELYVTF